GGQTNAAEITAAPDYLSLATVHRRWGCPPTDSQIRLLLDYGIDGEAMTQPYPLGGANVRFSGHTFEIDSTGQRAVTFRAEDRGIALNSDTLASVLTERPARVRLLGQTRMVPLNATAFIAVPGKGLPVPKPSPAASSCANSMPTAKTQNYALSYRLPGFLDQIEQRRAELLAAMLTIWRWGRQNASKLIRGKPIGSF